MIPVITILFGVFFFLFNTTASAKSYGSRICANDEQFMCYTVKSKDTWQSLFTNDTERDLVMRINRMNVRLTPGMKIAVPKNLTNANALDYAPFNRTIEPPGKKVILVSINDLAFGAYNAQGQLEYWGPVSTGKGYCADIGRSCHTKQGNFSIYRKEGSRCVSTKFPVGHGGAPMPYCMFFNGGFALHGSYNVPGYNDSHGCVRLFVNDAKWLNEEFTKMAGNVSVVIRK